MALREFTDRSGSRWLVWDIRPEQMPAAIRAEDHLQNVLNGWLAFETADGVEKRRLAPIPSRWESAGEAELQRFLERAEAVRTEASAPARQEPASAPRDNARAPAAGSAATLRTFRYPSGRYWSVNELPAPASSGDRPTLRFTSGSRSLEAREWPSEWARMSDTDLAELLYRSFPRDRDRRNPTGYRRRRGDIA